MLLRTSRLVLVVRHHLLLIIHPTHLAQVEVEDGGVKEKRSKDLIDAYKLLVRKGSVPGHLAICWGIITAALGLALGWSFRINVSLLSTVSLPPSTILLPPSYVNIVDTHTVILAMFKN